MTNYFEIKRKKQQNLSDLKQIKVFQIINKETEFSIVGVNLFVGESTKMLLVTKSSNYIGVEPSLEILDYSLF